jgi:hypothetical protein
MWTVRQLMFGGRKKKYNSRPLSTNELSCIKFLLKEMEIFKLE